MTQSNVDPYVSFMDAQRAQELAQYNARAEARYAKPEVPQLQQVVDHLTAEMSAIATVIEFKPAQVAVPVYAGSARELIAA
jgi:hypothetical protein